MSSQKALYLHIDRTPSPFVLSERDIPVPGKDEILVKVHAAGLGPVEWKIQDWVVGPLIFSNKDPVVLGVDIAGEVVRVGDGTEGAGVSVGDRVLFQGTFNNDYSGFQQFTKVPVDLVAKLVLILLVQVPKSLTYSQAASVPSGLAPAAIGLFSEAGLGLNPSLDEIAVAKRPNQPALVIGGSSTVGQNVIQLLRYLAFSPIITYASDHQAAYLKSLGATHVLDRKSVSLEDLPAHLKKITEQPIKVVFDAISLADTQAAAYASLADEEGATLLLALPSLLESVEKTNKRVQYVQGLLVLPQNRAFGQALFRNVEKWLEDGTVVPNRVEELPDGLLGVHDGLERMRKGRVSGMKLIALPQETK
ncbi:hypothetical protein V5O48_004815 [Marasmius crinis-equi]|uniref:Enoyl reductase (ER) domain-containing protein n=1 Tax=Marasmius crinis-equi TaxID=585013 RepID=A0ABR3FQ00_9AGAR